MHHAMTPDHSPVESIGTQTLALIEEAKDIVALLSRRDLRIVTVESCTGGAIAHFVTCAEGASDILSDSFVTYSTEAKIALGVPAYIIDEYTVYSHETATAMARAGIARSVAATIGIGVTGSISRKDPREESPEPGTVYISIVWGERIYPQEISVATLTRIEAKTYITRKIFTMLKQLATN